MPAGPCAATSPSEWARRYSSADAIALVKLALFGSVLREDFRPDSDVDVLEEFEPDARYGLFDLARMQSEQG